MVSRLKPGDNIRVQLLENSGKELTLKLSDGTVLAAASDSTLEAAEGEFVNLTFKGTIDGKPAFELTEKPLPLQGDKMLENVKNQLEALKLPLSEENIRIALALTEQNVSLSAENLAKMAGLLKGDSELKVATAAFLTASSLSEDAGGMDKLKSLLAGRLKLGEDILRLVKLLDTYVGETSGKTFQVPELDKLVQKITARLAGDGSMAGSLPGAAPDGSAALRNHSSSFVNVTGREGVAEVLQDNRSGSAGSARSAEALQGEAGGIAAKNAQTTIQASQISQTAQTAQTANTEKSAQNMQPPKPAQPTVMSAAEQTQQTAQVNKSSPDTAVPAANTEKSNIPLAAASNRSGSSPIALQVNQEVINNQSAALLGMLKGEVATGKSDFTLLNAFDRELAALMEAGRLSAEEMNTAVLLNQEKRVFAAAVRGLANLHIKISEASEEINPVRLYKEMDSLLHILKNGLTQLPPLVREAAAAVVGNLESNINFINQLNNYSSYVQLPLSIFNRNTTGELYMLKKGSKNKKLDPENMTVLISLDTDNLGRVDTLLSVNRKNISTNFRLENSEVFPLLRDSHKLLYNSLLEKGFRLVDYTYRLMDEPISIVNFEAEAKKEFLKSSSSIDITI